ncbi:helix-turn-helix domain-containing protein [Mycobacterium conspicuum]|uniref:helix-turn-helix domain-containing protein n=1 Tax=Mycobacterium conspicuum TaxID=44010 RepID=UPI001E36A360|nr:helix-turn-helix domain-containing protein [Mycobacterium conspicuum]
MRPAEQFDAARRLIAAGVNDCAISRELGVPRPTVQDWRRRPQIRPRIADASSLCGVTHDFPQLPPTSYAICSVCT